MVPSKSQAARTSALELVPQSTSTPAPKRKREITFGEEYPTGHETKRSKCPQCAHSGSISSFTAMEYNSRPGWK